MEHIFIATFHKKLDGFSTFYARQRIKDKTVEVPIYYLTPKVRKEIAQEELKSYEIKAQCRKKKTRGIEEMFLSR